MAKDTRKEEAEEREREAEEREREREKAKAKAAPKTVPEPPAGGPEGKPGPPPIDPETLLSEQEKIAAAAPDPEANTVPSDPKKPYPTGNPPTAEEERRRAMGLPRELTEDEKRAGFATGKRSEK